MNKEDKVIEPKVRFPEFKGKPNWKSKKLKDFLDEHGQKSTGEEEVHSVSVHKGVVNQIEHLGRSFAAASTSHYKRVLPGDIIYTKSPTGDFPLGIIKQSKVDNPVIVSPLYGVFTPQTKGLGTILDAYFESSSNTHNYLASIVQKGAKNTINITNETFLSKKLFIPTDPAEQQKIADCLSSLDELIQAETERLEALQAHKKGLMQQLFPAEGETVPKLRFPEFQDSGEWVEKKLGAPEVSSFVNQKVKVDELEDDSYVSTENLLSDFGGKVKISKLPNSGSFNCFLPGDILLSNIRPYLKKVWLSNQKGAASNDIIIIRNNRNLDSLFFSSLLKSDRFINHIMKSAEGVKMPRGNKDSIKEFKIVVPKRDEQLKIAELLTAIDIEISSQSEKIRTLKSHKKGLLQQLFPQLD